MDLLFDFLAGVLLEHGELARNLLVLLLENLDLVLLADVAVRVMLHLLLQRQSLLLERALLVVELALQGEEVLVERDAVAQKRFVTRSFVLLVDLAIFQKLDLRFHSSDLLLQIADVLLLNLLASGSICLPLNRLLLCFGLALEVGAAFELLVGNGALAVLRLSEKSAFSAWLSCDLHLN